MSSTDAVAEFDLDELIGDEFDFYAVDEAGQRFRLGETTYVFVDHDDCYEIVAADQAIDELPIARVTVEACDDHLYTVVDLHDGHVWMQIGVDVNSYTPPYTVFDYFLRVEDA